MARTFVRASSQYLERTSTPVAVQPLTMCAWVKATSFPATMTAISLCSTTTGALYLALGALSTGKAFAEFDDSGAADIVGGTTMSAGTWYHLLVTMDATQMGLYLNGVSDAAGVGTGTQTSWTPNCIDIGALNSGGGRVSFYNGSVAEVALYNSILDIVDITQLGLGMSPLLVKPSNLKMYAPLLGVATEPDYIAATGFTVSGATVAADHPRIFVPRVGLQFRQHPTSLANVQKTLTPTYNVKQQIQKTLSASYNVKQSISKNLASSYTVKKAITKTLSPSYNVIGHVNKTLTPSYSVRQFISKTLSASFGINGGVTKSLTASYNIAPRSFTGLRVRSIVTAINAAGSTPATSVAAGPVDGAFAVQKSLTTTYFVRISAAKALTTSYLLRGITSKSLSASFNIKVIVQKALATSYKINIQLSKSMTATYTVIVDGVRGLLSLYVSPLSTPIQKSLTGTYTIKVLVQKTLTTSYTVRAVVVKALAATFTIKVLVQKSLTNTYILAGKVQKNLAATYNLRIFVTQSLATSYTIKRLIPKNLASSYTIVQSIPKALVASYNISVTGIVQKALTTSYNVRVARAKSVTASYFILSTVPAKSLTTNYVLRQQVAKSLTTTYNKNNVLVVNLTTTYNVDKQIIKSLSPSYAIGGIVTRSLHVVYSIGNTATKSLTSTYTVKNLVTQSLSINYGITGRAQKILFVTYNIFRNPVSVGQHGQLTLRMISSAQLTMRQLRMTDIGDVEILQVEVRDRNGELINPDSISGWARQPDDSLLALSFDQAIDADTMGPILGVWEAAYEVTQPGIVTWRVETAGNVVAAGQRKFKVKPNLVNA